MSESLKAECYSKLKDLNDNYETYLNMFQGGGARVVRIGGALVLFEVPLYGGVEAFEGEYEHSDEGINEIYNIIKEWT